MIKVKTIYDVFLSRSQRDAEFAEEVTRIMQSYGLKVFTSAEITKGEQIEDALWEAMAESQAFVVIISESEPSALAIFELGAAKAWNKPVYAIAFNPSSTQLAAPFHGLAIYPPSRVEEIAQEIKRSLETLSDSERSVLIDEYFRVGVPLDQLMLQPSYLSRLTKQFRKRTKRQIASEELVRMLLRLRKKGDLREPKAKKVPKAN